MRFWLRELAGWLLVGLGLLVLYACFALLVNGYVARGSPLIIVGVFVFRGGIHLLKTAVAARVCLQANNLLRQREPGPERKQLPKKVSK
jgi:hypothetical protein